MISKIEKMYVFQNLINNYGTCKLLIYNYYASRTRQKSLFFSFRFRNAYLKFFLRLCSNVSVMEGSLLIYHVDDNFSEHSHKLLHFEKMQLINLLLLNCVCISEHDYYYSLALIFCIHNHKHVSSCSEYVLDLQVISILLQINIVDSYLEFF